MREHLSIKSNLTNGSISNNYIGLVFNSNQQEIIHCNSFALEMKNVNPNGFDLDDNVKLSVIDGLAYRILSRCIIFLNGVL